MTDCTQDNPGDNVVTYIGPQLCYSFFVAVCFAAKLSRGDIAQGKCFTIPSLPRSHFRKRDALF